MYSEQDYETIKNRMLDVLDTTLDKREGTFINDMYSPMAIEFAKTYIELDTIHSLLFVEDSVGDYLDKRVSEFGVMRKSGERAKGVVTFTGENNTLIPRNLEISTDGGYTYLTISQGYIKDGSIDILVEADEVGEMYNIEANATWSLPKDIVVGELSNKDAFEGGVDIESDGDLKKRFFDAVHNVRTSGNKNDYIYWAKETVGISNAEVYPLWNGNGTVKVVVSGENRMPVDILVEADEVGEIYNIEANATWSLPKDIVVGELSNKDAFEGGVDIESDGDLKKRFFDAVHNVRTSGNKNDYIYWAKETVGVYNAEVYPLWNGNGTVKVVVSGENRMPVDEEILQTCKNNIIENAPIGATLTVLTTTLFNVSINLSISIDESYDSSEVKLAVENAIKNYIGTCVDKIYYNKLGAKILSCDGVIDYTVLTINGSSSSVINIPADNVAVVTNINTSISEGVVYE